MPDGPQGTRPHRHARGPDGQGLPGSAHPRALRRQTADGGPHRGPRGCSMDTRVRETPHPGRRGRHGRLRGGHGAREAHGSPRRQHTDGDGHRPVVVPHEHGAAGTPRKAGGHRAVRRIGSHHLDRQQVLRQDLQPPRPHAERPRHPHRHRPDGVREAQARLRQPSGGCQEGHQGPDLRPRLEARQVGIVGGPREEAEGRLVHRTGQRSGPHQAPEGHAGDQLPAR